MAGLEDVSRSVRPIEGVRLSPCRLSLGLPVTCGSLGLLPRLLAKVTLIALLVVRGA